MDFQKKIVFDVKLKELSSALEDLIAEENVEESIDLVKQRKKEGGLADADIVKTVWNSVISAVQWSGKNQQQNINSALRQVCCPPSLLPGQCLPCSLGPSSQAWPLLGLRGIAREIRVGGSSSWASGGFGAFAG